MKIYTDEPIQGGSFDIAHAKPYFVWHHIDGPYIRFSDGQLHWLSWRERLKVRFFNLSADELEASLRPNLTATLKLVRKSLERKLSIGSSKVLVQNVSNRVSHTEEPLAIKYLVYLRGYSKISIQLWAEDYSVSPSNQKERSDIIAKFALTNEDQNSSIEKLKAKYPCPDPENL